MRIVGTHRWSWRRPTANQTADRANPGTGEQRALKRAKSPSCCFRPPNGVTLMAQFAIGAKYATGEGVPRDDVEAVRWWRRAAEQGFVDAELNLAAAYQNGVGVPKDQAEALMWYRKAAERGDADRPTPSRRAVWRG